MSLAHGLNLAERTKDEYEYDCYPEEESQLLFHVSPSERPKSQARVRRAGGADYPSTVDFMVGLPRF